MKTTFRVEGVARGNPAPVLFAVGLTSATAADRVVSEAASQGAIRLTVIPVAEHELGESERIDMELAAVRLGGATRNLAQFAPGQVGEETALALHAKCKAEYLSAVAAYDATRKL